jgi:ATP-binding cassette subfamily C protein CydCD
VVGGDVETVEFFFAHAISPMIVAVLIPGGLLIALAVVSWPIAVVLAPFLVAVAVSPFFANTRIEQLGNEIRGRMGDIHAFMVDSIQGMREIVAFGRGNDRNEELTHKSWDYAGHLVRFQKSQASQIGFMEAMMGLGGLAVLAMGVWLVLGGAIERTLLPLVSVLALSAFSPVMELARTMKQMMETLAASRRILEIHDESVPVSDGPGVPVLADQDRASPPSVDFSAVEFAYSEADPQALHGVSFEASGGKTIAIVGRSGAGKTTCAYLMMRFWDPQSGAIRLGNHRLDQYLLDDLRGEIALVAQDTYLFNSTIRENIRLGRHDATDLEVEEAAKQANAHEFITSFPEGYDTYVGERGMQLSGGQRQRISVARSILKNAPILILDEATSHLDAVSEAIVRDALDRMMGERTTLVIAHRLSTIRDADTILVLDDGRLIEQGTHEQLLAKGGLYAQLVSSQLVASTPHSSH